LRKSRSTKNKPLPKGNPQKVHVPFHSLHPDDEPEQPLLIRAENELKGEMTGSINERLGERGSGRESYQKLGKVLGKVEEGEKGCVECSRSRIAMVTLHAVFVGMCVSFQM
jgi:hypothetical protein